MNKEEQKQDLNLQSLQAATEYVARPPKPLDSSRQTGNVKAMSDSYIQAVEEFRLWSEKISLREQDFKEGRLPRS